MCVPVVTLSKEDNKDFIEQQNKGFQRSIYWNEYKNKRNKLKMLMLMCLSILI